MTRKRPRSPSASAAELVAAARDARDVLALVPEDLRACGGCPLRGFRAEDMPRALRTWTFDLTKRNMRELYERTWGWSNPEKRRELAHSDARFLVAFDERGVTRAGDAAAAEDDEDDHAAPPSSSSSSSSSSPAAFAHFRFEVEDDGSPVAYVYELQAERAYQRRGLGRGLMRAVEAAGKASGVAAVMLTVLKDNEGARRFYERRAGYAPDPRTPSEETCPYVILSKKL